MYRLLCIDIDGTLLTSKHGLSEGTLSAIERVAKDREIPVVLTTARPPQAVEKIYAALCLSCPAVCFNGALILNNCCRQDFTVLQSFTINTTYLDAIGHIAAVTALSLHYYKSWEWFALAGDDWTEQEERITETKADVTGAASAIKNWKEKKDGPHKILLMGPESGIDAARHLLQQATGNALSINKSKPTYLEITNRQASKSLALSFLLKKYDLPEADAVAIGDNHNDVAMLQLAGLGIAMANAPDDVKAVADFITAGNDEDGIKLALDKFIP